MRVVLISLLAFLSSSLVLAQPAKTTAARVKALDHELAARIATPEGGTTVGMCQANRDFEAKCDAEMNRVYRELLRELHGKAKEAFRKAQAKWLAFRDAQFKAFQMDSGDFGTGQLVIIASTRADMVRQRTLELAGYRNGLWGEEENSDRTP